MTPRELAAKLQKQRAREAGLDITHHAWQRMEEMKVSLDQVIRIARDGSSWPAPTADRRGKGLLRHLRDPDVEHLALICALDNPAKVITVIYWSPYKPVER